MMLRYCLVRLEDTPVRSRECLLLLLLSEKRTRVLLLTAGNAFIDQHLYFDSTIVSSAFLSFIRGGWTILAHSPGRDNVPDWNTTILHQVGHDCFCAILT